MRRRYDFNENWRFACGEADNLPTTGAGLVPVRLPHCWEPAGGFDCAVYKNVFLPNLGWRDNEIYLFAEHLGARGSLYINDTLIWESESGAEPLLARLTGHIRWTRDNTLLLMLKADSGKYAGLYSGVSVIEANGAHFSPGTASLGLYIEPVINGQSASVNIKCSVASYEGALVRLTLLRPDGSPARQKAAAASPDILQNLEIPEPVFWRCGEQNELYTVRAQLFSGNTCVDEIRLPFGFRTVDSRLNAPFLLNGEPVSLRGVRRDAQYPGYGFALPEFARERDISAISYMGANAVFIADGLLDEGFLTLCDKAGTAVFAQLPSPPALAAEALNVWKRLYHAHPSLCCVTLPDSDYNADAYKGLSVPGGWLCAAHGRDLPAIASLSLLKDGEQKGLRPSVSFVSAGSQPLPGGVFVESLAGGEGALMNGDRTQASDFYFMWMAKWSRKPVLRIAELPLDSQSRHVSVPVITNQKNAVISVNGKDFTRFSGDAPVLAFSNIPLVYGDNTIIASCEGGISDAVVINREKTGLFARWRAR